MITAEIIADSTSTGTGDRCTTFVLNFPRIVLAEFNTHRMLSRNSASSRAIPFKKMVAMAKENPFIPLRFQKTHTGMQGNEYFEGADHEECVRLWLAARDAAVQSAEALDAFGITKQLSNRTLEAYQYHKVIATGTEWQNFFALRAHPQAEIHIADLAEKMLAAYNESEPKQLGLDDWHIPFGDTFDQERMTHLAMVTFDHPKNMAEATKNINDLKVKIATARCARVSYNDFDGTDDYNKDIALHDRLASSGHWSPFEHCAVAAHDAYANFRGFKQYRQFFVGENQRDGRVVIK